MKLKIDEKRSVGDGEPCFIVAEMSGNHNQEFDRAVRLVQAAHEAGADAIKLQTYTPDTITFNSRDRLFEVPGNSTWAGRNLYELYQEAHTPWDWQPKLKRLADELGMICFSSPFDRTAVDFLESMGVPLYKIASFELVDLPLIRYVAQKGKPLILSTGMATRDEIHEAVQEARQAGNEQILLLKCVSAYPAPPEEMNLRTIPDLKKTFLCPAGLSDHTLGQEAAVASVALGANVIEKHLTLSRREGGPDSSFSLEPAEFGRMVAAIRVVEKSLGRVSYEPTEKERVNKTFRRSLFVVRDVKKGETFTEESVKSLRPSAGLLPKYLYDVVGQRAKVDIKAGTPLQWDLIERHPGRAHP
jgi:pseudaminic acid synthase